MTFSFGDIVLVALSGQQDSPAVVISSRAFNDARSELVILAIAGQLVPSRELGEVWIGGWREAGLPQPSAIKPVFATIEQARVQRRLGALTPADQIVLHQSLSRSLGELG